MIFRQLKGIFELKKMPMDLDLYVDMTIHVIYISVKSRKIEYFGFPFFLL